MAERKVHKQCGSESALVCTSPARVAVQWSADLGSWHGREGVGGSENRLVVHHGLGSHHWYSAHLTHLGGDLAEDKRECWRGRRSGGDSVI